MSDELDVNALIEKKMRNTLIDKKIDETCNSVECLKNSFEKFKEKMELDVEEIKKSNSGISKNLNEKLNTVSCKCGGIIPIGASYCPNCSAEIKAWNGTPNWVPYKDRKH